MQQLRWEVSSVPSTEVLEAHAFQSNDVCSCSNVGRGTWATDKQSKGFSCHENNSTGHLNVLRQAADLRIVDTPFGNLQLECNQRLRSNGSDANTEDPQNHSSDRSSRRNLPNLPQEEPFLLHLRQAIPSGCRSSGSCQLPKAPPDEDHESVPQQSWPFSTA